MGYTFASGQMSTAFANFQANMAVIHAINTDPSKTYWASANKFANLSFAQFSAAYLMPSQPSVSSLRGTSNIKTVTYTPSAPITQSVNWLTASKVTPVRSQGQCGMYCCPCKHAD